MLKKLIYVGFLLFMLGPNFTCQAARNLKVTTSVVPLGSLIAMIGGDKVQVMVIADNGLCIDHHHLKPSQLRGILDSDIIMVISKKFDGKALTKLDIEDKIIYLSRGQASIQDGHTWLNIDHSLIILEKISTYLSQARPEDKAYFRENYDNAISSLKELKRKFTAAHELRHIVVLTNSLKSFFLNYGQEVLFYPVNQESLSFHELENFANIVEKGERKCLVINEEQSKQKFAKILGEKQEIIQLNIEHWQLHGSFSLSDLYLYYLKENLDKIASCKNVEEK